MLRAHETATLLGLLLALPVGAHAAATPAGAAVAGAGGQGFPDTTQVTAVEVPVQVVRDGEPVRGLTAADFEVYDGRRKQVLTGFDVVDLAIPENQRLSTAIPATLLAGGTGGGKALPVEIYAYAVDAQGSILDYFDQTLRLDVDKAGPVLRQGGLKFFGHLELPAGDYSVRVLVRNGETGAYGKLAVLVTVPPFAGDRPVLLPPFFPEASGRWTVARESPRGEQQGAAYPFTVGRAAYVPAAMPSLRSGEAAAVALVGYNLGAGQVEAQARVQAADGRDLGAGELRVSGRAAGSGSGPDVFTAVFRAPEGLAPGQYRLIVTVTVPGGSQTGTSLFRVPAPVAGHAG